MNIREQFPIFKTNPNLVYLDNAATTQKPKPVIEMLVDYYSKTNANVHRGLYPLSENSTELYEFARRKVAKFINAEPEEIIFTSGTTDGINGIAQSLAKSKLIDPKPSILLTELEHHANILPWQALQPAKLEYIPINDNYELKDELPGKYPDVVAFSLVSNVTGTVVDAKKLISQLPESFSVVDAAQAVAHMPIDVKDMNCDFLVFSGHKIFGPTGIGVVYGRKGILEQMEPWKVGGGIIREVHRDHAIWGDVPNRFEAGTPPIAEAIALASTLDFVEEIGWKQIQEHEQELSKYAIAKLSQVPQIKLFHPANTGNHMGVFSFTVEGVHPHDLSQLLGDSHICIRAGHHCTQILHRDIFRIPASARASISIYNNEHDIDELVAGIKQAIKLFS